jgi:hypothetical protein
MICFVKHRATPGMMIPLILPDVLLHRAASPYDPSMSVIKSSTFPVPHQEQRVIVADYVKELLFESKAYELLLGELST